MYTTISNFTFIYIIVTHEMKCPVCQNNGSSLNVKKHIYFVLKYERKPAFLGLGSFHPDTVL